MINSKDKTQIGMLVKCKKCGEEPNFSLGAYEKFAFHHCKDGVIVLIDIVFRFDKTVAEIWNDWNKGEPAVEDKSGACDTRQSGTAGSTGEGRVKFKDRKYPA